jgi:hypothetical protein
VIDSGIYAISYLLPKKAWRSGVDLTVAMSVKSREGSGILVLKIFIDLRRGWAFLPANY